MEILLLFSKMGAVCSLMKLETKLLNSGGGKERKFEFYVRLKLDVSVDCCSSTPGPPPFLPLFSLPFPPSLPFSFPLSPFVAPSFSVLSQAFSIKDLQELMNT